MSAVEPPWSETRESYDGDRIDDRFQLVEAMSTDEPVWAEHGKTSTLQSARDSRSKRSLLELISVEQPYWAARGRRTEEESEEKRATRSSFLESLSAEEPFWAARGRRGFLESLSAEEPFWAARGKKESPRITSPSPENFLSQVSAIRNSRSLITMLLLREVHYFVNTECKKINIQCPIIKLIYCIYIYNPYICKISNNSVSDPPF
jgi:hypothetical protein